MFERGVFVMTLIGQRQGAVQGLLEIARKRRHVSSRDNELYSPGVPGFPSSLLLFHDALQRMLVFAGKVHDLRHLGLGHLVGVDPAFADAVLMHVHHNSMGRFVSRLVLVMTAVPGAPPRRLWLSSSARRGGRFVALAAIAVSRRFMGTRRWQPGVSMDHNKDSARPVPDRVCRRIVGNSDAFGFANLVPERP